MTLQSAVYILIMLFLAFVLEHIPVPDMLSWFTPSWVMLVITAMVMFAPAAFGLWIAVPLGLMLDVEHGSLLGLHVLLVGLHVFLLQ